LIHIFSFLGAGRSEAGVKSESKKCDPAYLRTNSAASKSGVPNLGYMYPQGYICLSEGVHLRLAEDEKNIFTYYLFPNIYTYITE